MTVAGEHALQGVTTVEMGVQRLSVETAVVVTVAVLVTVAVQVLTLTTVQVVVTVLPANAPTAKAVRAAAALAVKDFMVLTIVERAKERNSKRESSRTQEMNESKPRLI